MANHHDDQSPEAISRRTLLTKYGPYTAPVVVAMLTPSQAYAHMAVVSYGGDLMACQMDSTHMTMNNMGTNHCTNNHGL